MTNRPGINYIRHCISCTNQMIHVQTQIQNLMIQTHKTKLTKRRKAITNFLKKNTTKNKQKSEQTNSFSWGKECQGCNNINTE